MAFSKTVGAISGIATPIVAFTFILLAIVSYSSFSWTQNALSDLGIVEGQTSIFFNVGLIVAGILAIVFSVFGLYRFFEQTLSGKLGTLVFAFASGTLVCIGVFNENFAPAHFIFSVLFFISAPISLYILAYALYLSNNRNWGIFTLFIGVSAAIPWLLLSMSDYVANVAIPETISGLVISVWIIAVSIKSLYQRSRLN